MNRLPRMVAGIAMGVAALTLPVVVESAAAAPDVYVVHEGDTLYGIARTLDVPLTDLLHANDLTLTSLIVPGQRLSVPAASHRSAAPSGASYTVVAGDTLSGIAAAHRVSLSSLLTVNDMRTTSLIVPGMRLALPAGATATPRSSVAASPTAAPSRIDAVVDFALAQLGKPYRFFTRGPSTFDCSGLTMAAYRQIGVSLVHHAATQARQGRAVDYWNHPIRRGDLVFLDGDWDGTIDHVGIALSSTMWVQASESHDQVLTGPLPSRSVIVAVRRFVTDG
jgi:peptidoglycan DL-endopeptidase LytE